MRPCREPLLRPQQRPRQRPHARIGVIAQRFQRRHRLRPANITQRLHQRQAHIVIRVRQRRLQAGHSLCQPQAA